MLCLLSFPVLIYHTLCRYRFRLKVIVKNDVFPTGLSRTIFKEILLTIDVSIDWKLLTLLKGSCSRCLVVCIVNSRFLNLKPEVGEALVVYRLWLHKKSGIE